MRWGCASEANVTLTAEDIVRALELAPHPEGGWYRETYRHARPDGGRGAMTAIYYLLEGGRPARWHRVRDADEIWHWYAGAPLVLSLSENGKKRKELRLGPAIAAGERPQALVPAGTWQTAASCGAWTLVGCTVAPAFLFEHFELAPPGWSPDGNG